jgi:NAD(P)-dependent dehydrogenase (short-subunit alcohol dehydrogenase family)
MSRFEERSVYITGAGSGVGRATALRLAGEGAHVFAADVNANGVAETVELVRGQGGQISGGLCDVADWKSVQKSIDDAAAALGGLDVLVNAAGIGRTVRLEEMDVADWQKVIAVNLTGPFHTTKAALPHLLKKKDSNIVNVASIAGVRGQAYASHYAASKAGLVNFTKAVVGVVFQRSSSPAARSTR